MREAQMNREAVLVIAELMWALRRSGAHMFFPGMPLHKARKLVLVGATVGLAHLRGRPVTLASLSRQLEMPHATTERRPATANPGRVGLQARHTLLPAFGAARRAL